ncbi:MAG: rubredoxin [Desulfobacterales bacterium]|nr:rubredoxin [Desulfobacterales bacterium]
MDIYECGPNGYVYDDAAACDGSPGGSRPCDYAYDPAQGDPDSGIAPGTAFENLPENWTCPVCGNFKGKFKTKA